VTWSLRVEDLAVNGAGHADSHVADVDELLDFSKTLRSDLTHLEGDEGTKGIFLLSECITNLANNFTTNGSRGSLPSASLLSHSLNALLVVGHGSTLRPSDELVVVGVDRGLNSAVADPFSTSVTSQVLFRESEFSQEWILAES